jgi:toxin-antitoxin system PIN domain toxin
MALALVKHPWHGVARDWFAAQTSRGSVHFCRSTQQSLLRLITTDSIMRQYEVPGMSNKSAWLLMDGLLADPRIRMASEPSGIEAHFRKFSLRSTSSPKLWMDAYLAAFAVTGSLELITTDRAFAQYRGLNPKILSLSQ